MKLQHKNLNSMKRKFLFSLAIAFGLAGSVWADLTQVNGVYQIGTAQDLADFASLVNQNNTTYTSANAVLTADIDMSTLASWTAIGDWNTGNISSAYKGHFDGQGHAITNFSFTASHNYYGIFGVVSSCLIENVSVYGTISTNVATMGGVVGYARDNNAIIRNVHSYVNLNNTANGKRVGGILGTSHNGTISVECCTYSGTLDGKDSGGNGNYGGIVGYVYNGSDAHLQVTNCLFDGVIKNTAATPGNCTFGGMVGYVGLNITDMNIKNCLSIGNVASKVTGQFYGAVKATGATIVNCYYKGDNVNGSSSTVKLNATKLNADDARLISGEICYALNGSISGGTNWYQTLGDGGDDYPLPYGSSLVYASHQHCDDSAYDNTYANVQNKDDHAYSSGFCTYCGDPDKTDENYMTPNGDGYYEIDSEDKLNWFAAFVSAGTTGANVSANAKLTANISLTKSWTTPIGIGTGNKNPGKDGYSGTPYIGTFDGQGYSITNFNAEGAGHLGLFGDANGATIKNFSISGSLTITEGYAGGAIAFPINSTIENVHSTLVVSVPNSGTHHVGGVVGSSRGGNTINKCSFSGSLTVAAGSTDCFAGIVGYVTSSDEVKNCANYGGVTFSEKNCGIGGIVGYLNDNSVSIKNCLNTGSVHFSGDGSPKFGGAIVGRLRTHNAENITNHYWLEGSAYGAAKDNDGNIILTTAVEADATLLSSGEVAYNLNGDQSDITFYQTIGSDAYPTFNCSHEQVLYVGAAGYTTFYDANKDWELVGDARAYIGSLTPNGGALHLDEIEDIPVGTAVVIGGTYYNKLSTDASATTTGNILLGSDGTVTGGDGIYALAKKNDVVGFYPVKNTVTIPAGKAYLNTAAGVKGFVFEFEDDETAIGSIQNSKFKIQNGEVYNLAGQKLSKLQKGINIVGDKKILK